MSDPLHLTDTPVTIDPAHAHAARITICAHAIDHNDARMLLMALGLDH